MENNNKFVEKLLDSALLHRTKPEPAPGLEARILERVRADAGEQSDRKKLWKFWVAAVAAGAAVAMITMIYVANRSHSPAANTTQAGNAVPAPAPGEKPAANTEATLQPRSKGVVAAPMQAARHERKPTHRAETPHWPSQFPTPAPLSPEEKALIQYVRDTPPQDLAASYPQQEAESESFEIKPLEIAPLDIPPLSAASTQQVSQ